MNESIKFYGNMIDCSMHGIQESDEHSKCPKCKKVSSYGVTDKVLGKTQVEPKNISDIEKNFDYLIESLPERVNETPRDLLKQFLRSQMTSLLEGMPLEEIDNDVDQAWGGTPRMGYNKKIEELNQWREEALK